MMKLPRSRLFGALAGGVAIASLGACALVLGIDPPELDPSRTGEAGAGSDSGAQGDALGSGDGEVGDGGADVDAAPPCVGDGGPAIDGIFVAPPPVGSDAANCGPKDKPCATIQVGVTRAHVLQKKVVLVARGTYTEAVTLQPDVAIEGAWELVGNEWVKSCVPPIHDAVVVMAPAGANKTIVAADLKGTATLRSLTVRSKDAASVGAGESLYGLFATGSTTKLVLDDVVVSVGAGGDGAPGPQGKAGADGDAGCATGSGADAVTAGPDGKAADAGAFVASGFVLTTGTSGGPGSAGQNGTLAAPTCKACYSCAAVTCNATHTSDTCGTAGAPGCAGQPSGGGGPGGSGGASVAVFAWDAQITATSCAFTSGSGGKGARGGDPGTPGNGGMGKTGDVGPACVGSCSGLIAGCNGPDVQGDPGVGGEGGAASAGGKGGAGAGGPSFAVVSGGSAAVNLTSSSLAHGAGGTSEGAGAIGASGDRFP